MNPTALDIPVNLGDERLNRRYHKIINDLASNPTASLPEACGGRAATEAAYRFFDNPLVKVPALYQALGQDVLASLADNQGTILAIQDTTFADFTDHPGTTELGYLANAHHFGLCVHSVLVVPAPSGVPLGLLYQYVWTRDPEQLGKSAQRHAKDTADKESQRWLDALLATFKVLPPERSVVTVGDREADFFDLFALGRPANHHLLIRAKGRRGVLGEVGLLGEAVRQSPERGRASWLLPRGDDRPSRKATFAIRYGTWTLAVPSKHPQRKLLSPLPLQAILLEEVGAPQGQEAVTWLLLTTLPVRTLRQARQYIGWYTKRWLVERYHFVLKSGSRYEELQLERGERLRRALAVYSAVATRLLRLAYQARSTPEATCASAFSVEEWRVLQAEFAPQTLGSGGAPNLGQAVRWVARLGGFLDRRCDGEPGVKTLWRGMRHLHDRVIGVRLAALLATQPGRLPTQDDHADTLP